VVFDAAHSSSSWTLPGVASLMTGLYTSSHGCWSGRSSLAAPIPTLAERLAAEGFDTGAVVSHVFLDRRYGLDRGFADYDDELVQETKAESHLAITSPRITDKALAWLEQRAGEGAPGRPWFLWVHYFDPHQEYRPHEGISEAFGLEQPSDLYDGEVAFTDRHVGRLLDGLDALGPAGETVVVVTSDHGEEFGDHGGSGHRVTLYEEVLRVPLMIRAPGAVPGRRAEVVSLVDLAPSALELLGLPPIEPSAGRSLVPLLTGRPRAPRPVLGELGLNVVMVESIVEANWKLVVDREEERVMLFDLARDPAEADDLAEAQPERVDELRALLAREVARGLRWGNEYGPAGELELSERDRARLRELGYVED
jgi:arylsulfatase A-like enzyme